MSIISGKHRQGVCSPVQINTNNVTSNKQCSERNLINNNISVNYYSHNIVFVNECTWLKLHCTGAYNKKCKVTVIISFWI